MIRNSINSILYASALLFVLGGLFTLAEPAIGFGAATSTSQFIISQVVTSEISFQTPATNITLSPSIGGLSGGSSDGTTQVVVSTNNLTGYTMTLAASSSVGMIGNAAPSNNIPAYVSSVANVPDYTFTTPSNKARFGYTISASTTAELDQKFLTNGSACNTGSTNPGLLHCWLNASTTAVTLITSAAPTAASGSTSTLAFHVVINANPTPAIPNDTYVATTTLTAVTNP